METDIKGIAFDSRKVGKGDLFIAVSGTQVDGHDFIDDVIKKEVFAIVCEKLPAALNDNVAYIRVENSAEALGIIASNYYGNPSKDLHIVGVTGTNGKTTTATLLFDLFRGLGYKCGLISTVENKIGEEVKASTHTTPDSIQIQVLLAEMLKKGCTHCFMEVSSHSIDQRRIFGIEFDGGIFTNISHDHLDYHKTFEEYIKAKKLFFDILPKAAFALVNVDDKRGKIMLQNTRARKKTFAIRNTANYKAKVLSNTFEGLELNVDRNEVWFKLIGDFNAYNILAGYGAAIELGESQEDVLTLLSEMDPAPGRFEQLKNASGVLAIVDYAHTPDALENVLLTIKTIRTGNEKVITVVGCGGDRDTEKRPKMASVACDYSDRVILTSDNPRNEDPEKILEDMQKGVSPVNFKKTLTLVDRKEAIKSACLMAESNDIILVAGKGHENYQEIKGVKHPFDDKLVLGKMLELTKN
jgi:UDP-N-acetylmuramoyl-L-alanyl-D-glutamate--2,6-diaminopimelate ligase